MDAARVIKVQWFANGVEWFVDGNLVAAIYPTDIIDIPDLPMHIKFHLVPDDSGREPHIARDLDGMTNHDLMDALEEFLNIKETTPTLLHRMHVFSAYYTKPSLTGHDELLVLEETTPNLTSRIMIICICSIDVLSIFVVLLWFWKRSKDETLQGGHYILLPEDDPSDIKSFKS